MKPFLPTLAILLLLAACAGSSETTAPTDAALAVDRRAYASGDSLIVVLSDAAPAQAERLCDVALERRDRGEWLAEPTWRAEPDCAPNRASADAYHYATALPKGVLAGTYRFVLPTEPPLATAPFNVTR